MSDRLQVGRSVDGLLRDRIAATLIDYWPSPWHGSDKQRGEVNDLADVLIAELGLPPDWGTPSFDNSQRRRIKAQQAAAFHTKTSNELVEDKAMPSYSTEIRFIPKTIAEQPTKEKT